MSEVACLHPGGLELTDRLVVAARLSRRAAVLDVGCGTGSTVARLADRYDLRATGLDASPERIRDARETRPDLDFVTGRAEALPFADASLDAVVCECVLSTLSDPGKAIGEIARVLAPAGAALLSDLYVREGNEAASAGGQAALGRRESVCGLLRAAGLETSVWQDHTEALGRYIWDLAGRREDLAAWESGRESGRESRVLDRRSMPRRVGRKLGYFICVARRT